MSEVGIKELLEAGVHFGHQTRRWNPKMRRYIYGERDGIHIIDLLQTEALLAEARRFAARAGGRAAASSCSSAPRSRPATRSRTGPSGRRHAVRQPALARRAADQLPDDLRSGSSACTSSTRSQDEGQLDLLPTQGAHDEQAELREARVQPRRRAHMKRLPDAVFIVDLKTEAIARARGRAPAHPDHRPRRHQLRPGRRSTT